MNPIRLKIQIPENKIAVGHSRFWGNPDLPIGVDYPMFIDEDYSNILKKFCSRKI